MGALSFSPSPITTTPVIETEPSTWRMASTAAWSTASLSPKPILRAAAMAAASVTRTSSRARLRSGASPWCRASISTSRSRPSIFLHLGDWHPEPPRFTLATVAPPARVCAASGSRALAPPIPPGWRQGPAARPAPSGWGMEGAMGGGHGHSHSHAPVPLAGSPAGEDEGLRAVKLSAAGLALTAGVLVVLAIAASAVVAAAESLAKLSGEVAPLRNPGWALAAAFAGVAGNEAVAQYKLRVGRRINSVPLEADGHHSRVDGLASLAAAAGIAGAWAGWPAADPLAGLLLSAVIAWVLVGTTRDVLARLLDRVDPEVIDQVERAAGSVAGVEAVHATRARWVGRSLHVLVHAEVDPDLPLRAAHDLGEQARHAIFHALPGVAEVDLHLDPAGIAEHDSHRHTLHHRDQGSR